MICPGDVGTSGEEGNIESSSDKPEIVFDSKKTFLIISFASFLADK